jgi:glycosyltransferase involved in cell wall biosynthesis
MSATTVGDLRDEPWEPKATQLTQEPNATQLTQEPKATGEPQDARVNPRVTIGLPVYNGAEYIVETLESLLTQDSDEFEIIISDNASTDGTADICAEYVKRDPRIKYTRNEQNLGGAYNYSRLVELAEGEYFKWASADDLCGPSFVSACAKVLDEHPEVVLAYPQTMMIDADGNHLGVNRSGMHVPWRQPWKRMHAFAKNRRLCNPCFGVIRTDVLRKTSLIQSYISSDITLLAQLVLAGPIHEVPHVLFYRRVTDTSCGLGTLTPNEVREWFDPHSSVGVKAPLMRVFWNIEGSILRARLNPFAKLLTLVVFTAAWNKRLLRPHYFRLRKKLLRR